MKKNFILFALMVFLPVLAFAQALDVTLGANPEPTTYDGNAKTLVVKRNQSTYSYAAGNYGYQAHTYRIYKGTYSNNGNNVEVGADGIKDAGTYTVRGRGNGNNNYYTSTITVNPKSIADESVTVTPIANQPFTGQAIEPEFTVQDGSAELDGAESVSEQIPAGVDYTYEFSDNTQVGTATITIKGQGNYTGSREVEFSIYNPSGNPTIFGKTVNFTFGDETPTYNGSEWYPATITIEGVGTLRKANVRGAIPTYSGDTDKFEVVSVVNNINAGLATVTLAGKGQYEGQAQGTFQIAQQPLTGASITLSAASVEYNGTSTTVGINSVVADGKTLVPGVDYLVYGYKYNAKTADTEAVPGHVGNWYVVVGPAAGSNYTAEAVSETSFAVTKRALKIDLLEIHKIYGDADPDLANIDINQWASINWAPGDGPSNTTISPIEFERLTVGETVYDENGNRNAFEYSLKNPRNLTATTKIGGVDYENYTVGVGQSSSLLIDQKPITVHVAVNEKNYGSNDPTDFTADKKGNNGQVVDYFTIKDADGNVITTNAANPANAKDYKDKATGNSLRAMLKDDISRAKGEDVTANGYAFSTTNTNYDVTFDAPFFIRPIGATVQSITGLVYNGKAQTPVVVKDGDKVLKENVDYTVTYSNNVNAGTASYTVRYQGNYTGTANGNFTIAKAQMRITAKSYSKTLGYEFNENDVEILFAAGDFKNGETSAVFRTDANYVKPKTKQAEVTDPKKIKIEFVKVNNKYGNSTNYEFVPSDVEGFLYIGRPVLIITARAQKVYGAADPDLSKLPLLTEAEAQGTKDGIIVEGWVKSESQAAKESFLKINGTSYFFEMEREEGEDAGYYDIDFEGPTSVGQEGDGYEIQYVDGTFTITTAPLTIYAQAAEKFYGEDDPEPWPIVAEGLKNGDTVEDLQYGTRQYSLYGIIIWSETEPTYTVTRESGENVGKYTVTNIQPSNYAQYNETLQNYTVTWKVAKESTAANAQNVKLTIKPIDIVIKVADAQITYGQEYVPNIEVESPTNLGRRTNAAIIAAIKDAKDTAGKYLLKYSGIPTETPINAGEYTISAEGPATVTNYAITAYNPGKLTVAKYALTSVKANDQGIAYAGTFNPYYLTINGVNYEDRANQTMTPAGDLTLPTGDKLSDVLALESTITKVGANKNAYTLNTNKAKSANYSFPELTNGYLTISALEYIPLGETALAALLGKPATEWPLSQVLKDHDGVTTDVKLADRGMFYDQWYGLVLPFDTKVSALSKKLDYAVVNTLNPNSDGYANGFNFEIAMGELPANTPFLVKVADENKKKADVAEITFEKVEIVYAEEPKATDKSGDFQIVGTWDSFVGPEGNCIVIRNSSQGPRTERFDNATADTKVRETEAYLRLPEGANPANVRILVQEADGTMTAINGVAEAEAEVAEGWYTINGVKLEGEPTVSGTYIFNGKKVFIQK